MNDVVQATRSIAVMPDEDLDLDELQARYHRALEVLVDSKKSREARDAAAATLADLAPQIARAIARRPPDD